MLLGSPSKESAAQDLRECPPEAADCADCADCAARILCLKLFKGIEMHLT